MKVLEGKESDVSELYSRIVRDLRHPRHQDMVLVFTGEQPKRDFKEWSMAFYDLDNVDIHSIEGYSEYLNMPLTDLSLMSNETRLRKFLILNF
jgi:hypothetical protein